MRGKKNTEAMSPLDATAECETGWLGRSLQVKGEITGTEDLLVDGAVEGLIHLDERKLTVGTTAKVTADIYGSSVTYRGKVAGIGGGTGASMAMIPAQNATGNWIKVIQRLPVRIELDPKELAAHPLRLGLSTEVEIDISGR